jgi:hypothetical protein
VFEHDCRVEQVVGDRDGAALEVSPPALGAVDRRRQRLAVVQIVLRVPLPVLQPTVAPPQFRNKNRLREEILAKRTSRGGGGLHTLSIPAAKSAPCQVRSAKLAVNVAGMRDRGLGWNGETDIARGWPALTSTGDSQIPVLCLRQQEQRHRQGARAAAWARLAVETLRAAAAPAGQRVASTMAHSLGSVSGEHTARTVRVVPGAR